MDWQKLDELAAKQMKYRESHRERERGFVYYHGKRVAAGALELRKLLLPDDPSGDDALRLAGMFHDVGKGLVPHETVGAAIFREIVKDLIDTTLIDRAANMIAAHPHRDPINGGYDIWTRILQDADMLDHSGSYGVWMNAQFYSVNEGDMAAGVLYHKKAVEAFWQNNSPLLNFDISRKIQRDKLDFEIAFFARAAYECEGCFAPLP